MGHLQFENVRFKYPNRPETMILKDLQLDIQAGIDIQRKCAFLISIILIL